MFDQAARARTRRGEHLGFTYAAIVPSMSIVAKLGYCAVQDHVPTIARSGPARGPARASSRETQGCPSAHASSFRATITREPEPAIERNPSDSKRLTSMRPRPGLQSITDAVAPTACVQTTPSPASEGPAGMRMNGAGDALLPGTATRASAIADTATDLAFTSTDGAGGARVRSAERFAAPRCSRCRRGA